MFIPGENTFYAEHIVKITEDRNRLETLKNIYKINLGKEEWYGIQTYY